MSRNFRNKTNYQLLQSLRGRIPFRRIDARWPRHVNPDDLTLAHALKYIELLQDDHVVSKHAEDLWYRELAIKIRRREAAFFYGPSRDNSNVIVSWAWRDVTIAAIELIDNLTKHGDRGPQQSRGRGNQKANGDAKEMEKTAGSSMKSNGMGNKVSVGVAHGQGKSGDVNSKVNPTVPKAVRGVAKSRTLMAKQDVEPNMEQQSIARALDGIEAFADHWLAGKLSGDGDWKSFENCLDDPEA